MRINKIIAAGICYILTMFLACDSVFFIEITLQIMLS